MAVTQTALTPGTDNTNASTSTTASVTPAVNELVLFAVNVDFTVQQASAPAVTATFNGTGLTFVEIARKEFWPISSDWWNTIYLFRAMGSAITGGTITINAGALTMDTCTWELSSFAGVDTSGTHGSGAIVQSATANGASVSTLTVTLAPFVSANNAAFGAFGAGHTGGSARTYTPGTGFTEIYDTGSEYAYSQTEWRNDNDTSVDTTLSASTSGVGGIAVEIKAAAAGRTTKNTRSWPLGNHVGFGFRLPT